MGKKERINSIVKKSIILSSLKQLLFRRKWRTLNKHNYTTAKNCFNSRLVTVGRETYGALDIRHFGNDEQERVAIGSYCSIGPDVTFVTGGEHELKFLSTYPFKSKITKDGIDSFAKGAIVVSDDVWIGYGATILSGVHIGQGSIVAAGAVVANDVPSYAIVGGVPAKVIRYRFEKDIRDELLKFDYSKMDRVFVKKNLNELYSEIKTLDDAKRMVDKLQTVPVEENI